MLEVQEQKAWHDIVTLDEPWFDDRIDHGSLWLRPSEELPERTHVSVQCNISTITAIHGRLRDGKSHSLILLLGLGIV
jgi:hypothetical protein